MTDSPSRHVFEMMTGIGRTQSIYTAAALELPEHIRAGHRTSAELAAVTSTHPRSLFQLLRLLAEYGIVQGDDEAGYDLTPAGELLARDAPGSMRDLVMIFGDDFYTAWGSLAENVRSGTPAFTVAHGAPMYTYFDRDPTAGAMFDRAMSNGYFFDAVPDAVDFSSMTTVVDVAGGTGGLLCTILGRHPHLKGVLMDQPRVIEAAREAVAARGLADRVTFVGGDYADDVPTGGDCYVLSRIVHRHDDDSGTDLLRRCRKAMDDDGTLVVIERPVVTGSTIGVWSDVHMMVLVGGIERTSDEYVDLLGRAGFGPAGIEPLTLDFVAMTARPA